MDRDPTQERAVASVQVPPWAIPAAMAFVGALGGYTGHDVMVTEQPAVLAQGISSLQQDVSELRAEIRELRDAAAESRINIWSKADHQDWVRGTLQSDLQSLSEQDEDLRDELEGLALRVRILETQ